MRCLHCQRNVKVNQIIRDARHDLGCVFCFGNPTPIMVAEAEAARSTKAVDDAPIARTFGAFGFGN